MNSQKRNLLAALSLCAAVVVPNTAAAVAISGQGTWESTLQGRDLDGNLATAEAYYDTALNITWLANTNYAGTTMNWVTANAWAASLNPYGSDITGWRLPTTVDVGSNGYTYTNIYQGVDFGFNITAHSEMSHMFYVTLGDKAPYTTTGSSQSSWGLTNTGPFSNLQSSFYYSATAFPPHTDIFAWGFDFYEGFQGEGFKVVDSYAWAVHTGDVGAPMSTVTSPPASIAPLPVPAATWLLGSGLLGLLGVSGSKKRQPLN